MRDVKPIDFVPIGSRLLFIKQTSEFSKNSRGLIISYKKALYKCSCGATKELMVNGVKTGQTQSCGCLHKERASLRLIKHGDNRLKGRTPEYRAWLHMKNRCYNKNDHNYFRYGGRGIVVCKKWKKSFPEFLKDVGRRPSPLHSLDRHPNNNGDYKPGNVRWGTRTEQARGRRTNVWLEARGKRMLYIDWVKELNITAIRLKTALKNNNNSMEGVCNHFGY